MKIAVVALTRGGCTLAGKIAEVKDCDVFVLNKRQDNSSLHPEYRTFASLKDLFPEILSQYRAVVLIMALGIVIRTIGPYLQGKDQDPAILVMDEAGRFVVSALSGHLGGANQLASQLAEKIGAEPVITTSTDVQGIVAIDELARQLGWKVEPMERLTEVNAALANGSSVSLVTDCDYLEGKTLGGYPVSKAKTRLELENSIKVLVTNKTGHQLKKPFLHLRPPNLYLGIGCRKGIHYQKIEGAVLETLEKNRLSISSIKQVGTCTVKKEEAALQYLARRLEVPIKYFTPKELGETIDQFSLTRSRAVKERIGVEGVCEPAAMREAPTPILVVAKTVFPGITVAVAAATSI
ncbi:cobalt-precorrin 5A hydrolase [Metallumcola ferriviriculae]|uniref:Cobalt-precorrin 5A hydrolase n=1 Tax=Metallumcola ferriviriculae TaxID=3039180 RepID=A0AAU0ULZ4_9FIRM|nr:cobalt-precorrin 5A hydrolase [Desulfitibacteraceae bacterium MK1]